MVSSRGGLPNMGDHPTSPPFFDRGLHVKFLLYMLHVLPSSAESQDSNRLTLAYFAISGLSILNALDQVDANQVINWVYGAQVLPVKEDGKCAVLGENGIFYGFRGSTAIGTAFDQNGAYPKLHDGGNIASTYSALAILRILGDDLSRVKRKAIVSSMKILQQPDGSFSPTHMGGETDLRYIFCAVVICAMLDDWTGLNTEQALTYILNCQSYDGGFGLCPGLESHGGATYCAISALKLLGYIIPECVLGVNTSSVLDTNGLIRWCIQRQSESGGFQGRLNKPADACYAFWVGGSLKMLGADHLYDSEALHSFQLCCQSKFGGFGKWPGEAPDLLHAYFGLCGFSLIKKPGLKPLCCELGIPTEDLEEFENIQIYRLSTNLMK